MVDTPFRITPNLGPDLTQVVKAGEEWYGPGPSPQLGVVTHGSDGRTYMWVEASGTIASATAPGTQVIVTVNGYDDVTVAAGSGGWYSLPDVAIEEGDRYWVAKGTAP